MGEAAVRDRAGGGIVSADRAPERRDDARVPVHPHDRSGRRPVPHRRCATGRSSATGAATACCCPPLEYDPDTGAPLEPASSSRSARAARCGRGRGSPSRHRKHPFDHPFAFALIRLDGADTRDRARHRRRLDRRDVDRHAGRGPVPRRARRGRSPTCTSCPRPARSRRTITPGDEPRHDHRALHLARGRRAAVRRTAQRFAEGLLDGRIIGQRSPASGKVYVPSRGYDNLERVPVDRGRRRRGRRPGRGELVHGHHAGAVLRPEGDRAVHPGVDPARRHRLADHRRRRPRHPASTSSGSACGCRPSGSRPRSGRHRRHGQPVRRCLGGRHRTVGADRRARRRLPTPLQEYAF